MAIAGNILGEATPPAGNSFNEATRGQIRNHVRQWRLVALFGAKALNKTRVP